MTPKVNRETHWDVALGRLRRAGLTAILVGAVGSVGLMQHAGRRNNSRILIALFALWVLSPFMALWLANVLPKRRSIASRFALYTLMLVLTLATLSIYGVVALGPPRAQTAFMFIVVPPASWLLIAIVAISGGRSGSDDGV